MGRRLDTCTNKTDERQCGAFVGILISHMLKGIQRVAPFPVPAEEDHNRWFYEEVEVLLYTVRWQKELDPPPPA